MQEESKMTNKPKWYTPVVVLALIWNLLGCMAYLSDVRLTPEDLAKMSAAQQALYASRPAWAVAATAFAVWGGALGCIGLIVLKRWSYPILLISLVGVIVQDVALFGISKAASQAGVVAIVLQGVVLLVAVGLVFLARKAIRLGWIS